MTAPVLRVCTALLLFSCLCFARWLLAKATTSFKLVNKISPTMFMNKFGSISWVKAVARIFCLRGKTLHTFTAVFHI